MKQTALFVFLLITASAWSQTLKVTPAASPAGPGSSQANWSVTQDGKPLLSWVEPAEGWLLRPALLFMDRHGLVRVPRTIAAHRKFFHHPAEVPGMVALSGGTLLAHWIEQTSESSEAEFVYVSSSRDGVKWSPPVMASHDKSQAQHGLASIVASGDHEASLIWLQALKGEDGPASLMRSMIGANGTELKEERPRLGCLRLLPNVSRKNRPRAAGRLSRPHERQYSRYLRHAL